MKRWEVIWQILDRVDDAVIIHANGYISRESFEYKERIENFYMIGSMGLASSIGLGLAICIPNRKIIILDGDGNILMNLGALAMIGEKQPLNLIHIVLDNEVYASTGGQRSISDKVDLDKIASAAGYSSVYNINQQDDLILVLERILKEDGPSFLAIKVDPGNLQEVSRVTITPEVMALRLKKAIYENN